MSLLVRAGSPRGLDHVDSRRATCSNLTTPGWRCGDVGEHLPPGKRVFACEFDGPVHFHTKRRRAAAGDRRRRDHLRLLRLLRPRGRAHRGKGRSVACGRPERCWSAIRRRLRRARSLPRLGHERRRHGCRNRAAGSALAQAPPAAGTRTANRRVPTSAEAQPRITAEDVRAPASEARLQHELPDAVLYAIERLANVETADYDVRSILWPLVESFSNLNADLRSVENVLASFTRSVGVGSQRSSKREPTVPTSISCGQVRACTGFSSYRVRT